MNIIYRFYMVCFLALMIVLNSKAQVNPVYKIMKERGWVSPIEKGLGILTPAQYDKEEFVSMGYNDTSIINLQKVGVNLLTLHKRSHHWNEKTLAALSDCIIIGTVKRIEHPFGAHSWFHTVAYVQVENYLRNDYNLPKMQIPIFMVSGPNGKGETAIMVGEDKLEIGEHVLLYLSASGLIRFASNNNMADLYKKLINDSTVTFEIVAKFNVENGKVISRKKERDLDKVRNNINIVTTAIHRNLSTNK